MAFSPEISGPAFKWILLSLIPPSLLKMILIPLARRNKTRNKSKHKPNFPASWKDVQEKPEIWPPKANIQTQEASLAQPQSELLQGSYPKVRDQV